MAMKQELRQDYLTSESSLVPSSGRSTSSLHSLNPEKNKVNADELREIIGTKPFRPVDVVTVSGDHYEVADERDVMSSPRRPELFILFTEDGVMHLNDQDTFVTPQTT